LAKTQIKKKIGKWEGG